MRLIGQLLEWSPLIVLDSAIERVLKLNKDVLLGDFDREIRNIPSKTVKLFIKSKIKLI